jgi:hypothetical protein
MDTAGKIDLYDVYVELLRQHREGKGTLTLEEDDEGNVTITSKTRFSFDTVMAMEQIMEKDHEDLPEDDCEDEDLDSESEVASL